MNIKQNQDGVLLDVSSIHPNELHLICSSLAFVIRALENTNFGDNYYNPEKGKIIKQLEKIESQLHVINNQAETLPQTILDKVYAQGFNAR